MIISLKGHDYPQPEAYFVTICTYQWQLLLGKIIDGMILDECEEIVLDEWFKTAQIRDDVQLHEDEFVVMPNYVHSAAIPHRKKNSETDRGVNSNECPCL